MALVTETELRKRVQEVIFIGSCGCILPPLCGMVVEYAISKAWTSWVSPSDYVTFHTTVPTSLCRRDSVKIGHVSDVWKLIEHGLVHEIELTHEDKDHGGNCFTFIRLWNPVPDLETLGLEIFTLTKGWLGMLSQNLWPLPFFGPTLKTAPSIATYLLENGAIFDLVRRNEYQIKFTCRS
jgi:hypothetical protein